MQQSASRGFFSKLLDLSFRDFVTPSIISVIYVIAIICLAVWAIVIFASAFMPTTSLFGVSSGPDLWSVIYHAVLAVVWFVVGLIVIRIQLEFAMAVFRIAENTTPKS